MGGQKPEGASVGEVVEGGELLIISCFGSLETVAKIIQETMDAEFSNFDFFFFCGCLILIFWCQESNTQERQVANAELGMPPGAPRRGSVHNCIGEWLQLRHTAPEHGLKVPDLQVLPFPSLFASGDLGKPAALGGLGVLFGIAGLGSLHPLAHLGPVEGLHLGPPSEAEQAGMHTAWLHLHLRFLGGRPREEHDVVRQMSGSSGKVKKEAGNLSDRPQRAKLASASSRKLSCYFSSA